MDAAEGSGVREVLQAKQAEVAAEIAALSAPPEDTGGIGFGKRVGDGTSIAVERLTLVAAHDRMVALLADVRRALAKLDDGSYGRCDTCGARIPTGRLEALPWAVRCVACASAGVAAHARP
jgi:DnaK suppressor protein